MDSRFGDERLETVTSVSHYFLYGRQRTFFFQGHFSARISRTGSREPCHKIMPHNPPSPSYPRRRLCRGVDTALGAPPPPGKKKTATKNRQHGFGAASSTQVPHIDVELEFVRATRSVVGFFAPVKNRSQQQYDDTTTAASSPTPARRTFRHSWYTSHHKR